MEDNLFIYVLTAVISLAVFTGLSMLLFRWIFKVDEFLSVLNDIKNRLPNNSEPIEVTEEVKQSDSEYSHEYNDGF